jgi:hypothetical protein
MRSFLPAEPQLQLSCAGCAAGMRMCCPDVVSRPAIGSVMPRPMCGVGGDPARQKVPVWQRLFGKAPVWQK